MIEKQVWIEVSLPVIPYHRSVVAQVGALYAGPRQGALGITIVVARGVIEEHRDRVGQAHVGQHEADDAFHRWQSHQGVAHHARYKAEHARIQAHVEARGVPGFGKHVDEAAHTVVFGVREVKTASFEVVLVKNVVHGVDHIIDRHDVELATFDADQRKPGRQHRTNLLQALEEVVNAVDLVYFAGSGVPDNHGGPVHAPGHFALVAHDAFGVVLGGKVGVAEVLRFLEHVFPEDPGVEPAGGDGADVLKRTRMQFLRQVNGVSRALDIGGGLCLGRGGNVIDGREVAEIADFAL